MEGLQRERSEKEKEMSQNIEFVLLAFFPSLLRLGQAGASFYASAVKTSRDPLFPYLPPSLLEFFLFVFTYY